jgi:endonuclease-3
MTSAVTRTPPCLVDQLDATPGADVADVQPAAGQFGEHQVAGDDDLLGRRGDALDAELPRDLALMHRAVGKRFVLAVDDHRAVQPRRGLQRTAHDRAVGGGVTVVRPADRAGVDDGLEIDRLAAGAATRDRRDRVDAGPSGGRDITHQRRDDLWRVKRGLCVRHASDRHEPARRRGGGAGGDRLFLGEARLTEMHVDVDPRRRDQLARRVDDLGAFRHFDLPDRGDPALLDQDVGDRVDARRRVDDAPASNDHRLYTHAHALVVPLAPRIPAHKKEPPKSVAGPEGVVFWVIVLGCVSAMLGLIASRLPPKPQKYTMHVNVRTEQPMTPSDTAVEDAIAEKFDHVERLLDMAYGPRMLRANGDPMSELVGTILSQNTSDTNTARSLASLRATFPTWEDVMEADTGDVVDAIRSGGLANRKAPRIQAVIREVIARRGDTDLTFLGELPRDEAKAWLTSMHGIGPKTAACVLLFSLGRPAMPVDTHVHRVSLRLGLVPPKTSPERTQIVLEALLGDDADQVYAVHVEMISHGRQVCRALRPLCDICPLREHCDYFLHLRPAT